MMSLIWCNMTFLLWWDTEGNSNFICPYLLVIFSIILSNGPIALTILFTHNSNLVEISFIVNPFQANTILCTCHDSIAVMACAKFCSDNSFRIWKFARKIVGEMVPLRFLPDYLATLERAPYIMTKLGGWREIGGMSPQGLFSSYMWAAFSKT